MNKLIHPNSLINLLLLAIFPTLLILYRSTPMNIDHGNGESCTIIVTLGLLIRSYYQGLIKLRSCNNDENCKLLMISVGNLSTYSGLILISQNIRSIVVLLPIMYMILRYLSLCSYLEIWNYITSPAKWSRCKYMQSMEYLSIIAILSTLIVMEIIRIALQK